MPANPLLARFAAAFSAVFVLLLLACAGSFTPPPVPGPPPAPAPQVEVKPRRNHLNRQPVVRTTAAELFDMGQEGETKYKGQVVHIRGKVDVHNTKRPGPGGTTDVTMQGDAGEPPHAIVTIGQESEQLLFGSRWQPASVSIVGIYRGRDARGTVLVEDAGVLSLSSWFPVSRPGRKQPKKPIEKPAAPIVISAQQLAQELHDDINTAYRRYGLTPLQIQGVVHSHMMNKGRVGMIRIQPPIKDKKTGKPVELVVFCSLRTPLAPGSKELADIAVGKTVTLRGTMFAAGNGQATIGPCEIVRE